MSGVDNLKPIKELSSEEAKQRGSKGGIRSGQVRREKKLMTQIYAEFLEKEHNVIGRDGEQKKRSGQALLNSVMSKVLSRSDGSSVRLMKEIREATEGQNIKLSGEINIDIESRREALKEKLKTIANNRTDKA